jgi:dCMP deaminase
MRPARELIHMTTAIHWSYRALCSQDNRKVGAIITTSDMRSILAFGYNGPGKGLPNDHCKQWRIKAGDYMAGGGSANGGSRCPCLHAEDNAIAHVDSTIPDKTLFVTMQPCETCAHRILNANIKRVFFWKPYRLVEGVELLTRAGVQVDQLQHTMLDDFNRVMKQTTFPTLSGT